MAIFTQIGIFQASLLLNATLKQQEGIKLHMISKINISTAALNQFLAIQTVCKEMPLRQSKVLLVKM